MTRTRWWVAAGVATAAAAVLLPVWPVLSLSTESGDHGTLPLGDGAEFSVVFTHSIDHLPVADQYRIAGGQVVLDSTRVRSFGAGMGHIPNRGHGAADGADWVVAGIDEPVGDLHVRPGHAEVNHRLVYAGGEVGLTQCWEGQRVTLSATRVSTLHRLLPGQEPDCVRGRE